MTTVIIDPRPAFSEAASFTEVIKNMTLHRTFLDNPKPLYTVTVLTITKDDLGRYPGLATEHSIYVRGEGRKYVKLAVGRWLAWLGEWGVFRCFGYQNTSSPYQETTGLIIIPIHLVDATASSARRPSRDHIDEDLHHDWSVIPSACRENVCLAFDDNTSTRPTTPVPCSTLPPTVA